MLTRVFAISIQERNELRFLSRVTENCIFLRRSSCYSRSTLHKCTRAPPLRRQFLETAFRLADEQNRYGREFR
ncbi:hypothetical protein RRG08_059611 [Elysia crispata]|uniref:Uncharacterized protein n=1 Tax=Elysia crispata TaxID=231223 RepID=A0AAE0ZQY7_9GAST|nr:hypothetical protein RRG08_059611 [Elysia crispata]